MTINNVSGDEIIWQKNVIVKRRMLYCYPAPGVPIVDRLLTCSSYEKVGRIYCLAGVAAHVNGMVESAKGAKIIVALDGCQVACAKKAVEHAGLTVTDWICIIEQGISNNRGQLMDEEEIELIARKTRELLTKPPAYGV